MELNLSILSNLVDTISYERLPEFSTTDHVLLACQRSEDPDNPE